MFRTPTVFVIGAGAGHEIDMRMLGDDIVVGETLENVFQNIAIVTFNYDRGLEHFLWKALQDRFGINAEAANGLVSKLEVLHAYGQVAPLDWQAAGGIPFGGPIYGEDLDLNSLSENIRTYNEEVEKNEQLQRIHERITWARRIVFLGFHFHEQNVELITPKYQQRVPIKHAFATVIERKLPEQNKIERQINSILSSSAANVSVHLEDASCRELFSIWGTTLSE